MRIARTRWEAPVRASLFALLLAGCSAARGEVPSQPGALGGECATSLDCTGTPHFRDCDRWTHVCLAYCFASDGAPSSRADLEANCAAMGGRCVDSGECVP